MRSVTELQKRPNLRAFEIDCGVLRFGRERQGEIRNQERIQANFKLTFAELLQSPGHLLKARRRRLRHAADRGECVVGKRGGAVVRAQF